MALLVDAEKYRVTGTHHVCLLLSLQLLVKLAQAWRPMVMGICH